MTPFGLELMSGDTLHPPMDPADARRLIELAPRSADRVEIVTARLSGSWWHAGNGAFDAYLPCDDGDVEACEVKEQVSKLGENWGAAENKYKQAMEAEYAGIDVLPLVTQIVTDEAGRRTWCVTPGVLGWRRMFVANPRSRLPVSAQVERYIGGRLQSVGGAALLRDVPARTYLGWLAGKPIATTVIAAYRVRRDAYRSDKGLRMKAKKTAREDFRIVSRRQIERMFEMMEMESRTFPENPLAQLKFRLDSLEEKEEQLQAANDRLKAQADLARQLAAALQAGDTAEAARLAAELQKPA